MSESQHGSLLESNVYHLHVYIEIHFNKDYISINSQS